MWGNMAGSTGFEAERTQVTSRIWCLTGLSKPKQEIAIWKHTRSVPNSSTFSMWVCCWTGIFPDVRSSKDWSEDSMKTEMLQLFPMNLYSWRKCWSILTKKNIWEVASAAQLWNAVGQPILMVENPPGHRGIQSSKEWETVEVWRKDQRFMKGRLLETSESTSLLKGQNLENNKKKLFAPPPHLNMQTRTQYKKVLA